MKYLFLFFPFFLQSQNLFELYEIGKFPAVLNETSGLETKDSNSVWTHTDSGGEAALYKTNTSGTLLKTVKLINASNLDFEDICFAQDGKVFIGDFGNNLNDRKNLRIFITSISELESKDSVMVDTISFSYPDQSLFPPAAPDRNFDCEAFFHFNNFLYLFTKHRGNYNYTKCYRMPALKGLQTPVLLDSFATNTWITAADISPNGKRMALLSETKIQLFENFGADSFFHGKYTSIPLSLTQKEGIVFVTNEMLYLSDEASILPGGKLYKMYVDRKVDTSKMDTIKVSINHVILNEQTISINDIPITWENEKIDLKEPFTISLYDTMGRLFFNGKDKTVFNLPDLKRGTYFLYLKQGNIKLKKKFLY